MSYLQQHKYKKRKTQYQIWGLNPISDDHVTYLQWYKFIECYIFYCLEPCLLSYRCHGFPWTSVVTHSALGFKFLRLGFYDIEVDLMFYVECFIVATKTSFEYSMSTCKLSTFNKELVWIDLLWGSFGNSNPPSTSRSILSLWVGGTYALKFEWVPPALSKPSIS